MKNVCVLVSLNGKYLAVSRKKDPNTIGLVGGKIEPGESIFEAAKREFYEETGYELGIISSEPVYTRTHSATYLGLVTFSFPECDYINPIEGNQVLWVTREELCDPTRSPFAEYNQNLFRNLEK